MNSVYEGKAIAIKTGYMNSASVKFLEFNGIETNMVGPKFCIKGDIYRFRYHENHTYPFAVETIGSAINMLGSDDGMTHSMSEEFFYQHFKMLTEFDFIKEEEMMIL